jgi:hypothetical protein
MNYYVVDKIGDGSKQDPFRPNITSDVSYVCTEINDNKFLVGTNEILLETTVTDLQSYCNVNGIVYEDVLKWFVGD